MFCPKCHFTSFDHLDNCPKCGSDWTETKKMLNLDWIIAKPIQEPQTEHQEPNQEFIFDNNLENQGLGRDYQETMEAKAQNKSNDLDQDSFNKNQKGFSDNLPGQSQTNFVQNSISRKEHLDKDIENSAGNEEEPLILDENNEILDKKKDDDQLDNEEIDFPHLQQFFSEDHPDKENNKSSEPVDDNQYEEIEDLDILLEMYENDFGEQQELSASSDHSNEKDRSDNQEGNPQDIILEEVDLDFDDQEKKKENK